jgi:D-alanyl-D-alanine carboxypeptidase
MVGTKAQGVLRAKTGTFTGAYNLSGYIPKIDASGFYTSYSPFVMLANSKTRSKVKARHAQDLAGAKLAKIINP